ncbi:MAG: NADH-quinone oxidoreductase subunit L, partial [Actinomycetota bacterium]|nr:NADH-quinone oxidoreductase subunit L [Actinomycetota bacterium]
MSGVGLAAVAVCALPLCAAVANGLNALTGDRLFGPVAVARLAVGAVVASFAVSVYIAVVMVGRPGSQEITVYRFMDTSEVSVDFGFLLDPLSVVMMLVVTSISALVTHFSVRYMHNEEGFTRYFTVVSLFVFAMLVLVMADNYLVMFLGWEGVGVCSYLLIGFYRARAASAQAATQAFVMNRIGDAALLIAMFVLVAQTGTLNYADVFGQASSLPSGAVEAVGLLLLLGATGKSAQLPLGTWLARAMEGPTPSSALMHAATMVTAGVYLVVRSAPIYDYAANALIAVGVVGALTALFGQLVGYVQTDIKGLLAASTTAQLGLMFLFCGLGLYAVAIFHLVAHAFYKSYLFLTAPSVLHQLHGGPDPTAVGRPADTARLVGAAALAVAAGLLVAPLVGRFLELGGGRGPDWPLWGVLALGLIALFAAAFSTRRMAAVAFAGHDGHDAHGDHADHADHAGPGRLILAWGVLAGLIALGWVLGVLPGGFNGSWFQRLLGVGPSGADPTMGHPILVILFIGTIALLLLSGWYGPRYLDRFREELPPASGPGAARRLYWWALNRGYLDESYNRAIVAPTTALGRAAERLDTALLDRPAAPSVPTTMIRTPGPEPATWEARFLALRRAGAAGGSDLAEPVERLDWLPAAADAGPGRDRGPGTIPRAAQAAKRASAWSERVAEGGGFVAAAANMGARAAEGLERVAFAPREGRGVFGAIANASAGLAERMERVVFQRFDTGTLRLAGIIAGVTDAVERIVFQSGVEQGLTNAASRAQRLLLVVEARLGHPMVIGS